MKVFVTGGSGYIGSALVKALHRAGHAVSALVRSEDKFRRVHQYARAVLGDLRQPESYRQEAAQCDALIHTAVENSAEGPALDRQAIDTLLEIASTAQAARTLVYTSGVWVLGNTGGRPADESASTASPAPIVAWRTAHEQRVLEAGAGQILTAVVRPGIVYGGQSGLFPDFFRSAADNGAAAHVGDGQNHWASVHVRDLADVYVRIVEMLDPISALTPRQRIFHAVDGTFHRVQEIAAAASRAAGEEGKTKAWPVEEARQKLGPLADALGLDQMVSAVRTERVLGWRPRYRGFVHNVQEVFEEWSASL